MTILRFICLSKSIKVNDHCIAGKIISQDGNIGSWIRPVNQWTTINSNDCLYADQSSAETKHVIDISVIKYVPTKFQTENILIDTKIKWLKHNEYPFTGEAYNRLCDSPAILWVNEKSSGNGRFDQVSPEEALNLTNSLYFIYVGNITIKTSSYEGKFKIRGEFVYRNVTYNFSITSPVWREYYRTREHGTHTLHGRYVTISLALETFQGYHYKIIAEII